MEFKIQGNSGVLMIAEIGGNHEGDFEYAKKLVRDAVSTKADVVKLQLYTGDTLVNKKLSPTRNEHFKKFELSKEQYIELAKMVIHAGKYFTASVWDLDMLDWIDPYMAFYKIGSGDLTAYPVIKRTAELGKPIIISAGLSTEQEVIDCVKFIQSVDKKYCSPEYLAVLQCTAMYPIEDTDANLAVINRFKQLFGVTVGYSDHTRGSEALKYSVAAGAEVLEFHFTDSRDGKVFRDHFVSLTPKEVDELYDSIFVIKGFMGDETKKPLKIEIDNGHPVSFRRGVFPIHYIPKGKTIEESDLVCLRPAEGISAVDYYKLIGKVAKEDLEELQELNFSLFE